MLSHAPSMCSSSLWIDQMRHLCKLYVPILCKYMLIFVSFSLFRSSYLINISKLLSKPYPSQNGPKGMSLSPVSVARGSLMACVLSQVVIIAGAYSTCLKTLTEWSTTLFLTAFNIICPVNWYYTVKWQFNNECFSSLFQVNKQLKTVNNYYLLSLAFADLIIGILIVLPVFIRVYRWCNVSQLIFNDILYYDCLQCLTNV